MFNLGKINFKKVVKFNGIPTENLYIALVGYIKNQVIPEHGYVIEGEYAHYYTAVMKQYGKYIDMYNGCEYVFRDEEDKYTILKLYGFSNQRPFVMMSEIDDKVRQYNEVLDGQMTKKGNNEIYVKTRKLTK